MSSSTRNIDLWQGQLHHALSLFVLLLISGLGWTVIGKPSPGLFWLAVSVPVVHQVYVWLAWRLELKYSYISKKFSFQLFVIVFFVLFIARFISLALPGWVDQGSLGLTMQIRVSLTVILLIPGLYAMYSVKRYFGLSRAAGADHFMVEYQKMPLVKKGIFKYTGNGMYIYAFLLFWVIAVSFNSMAALLVALFSHVYIWVHYYCTERPDMNYIYGTQ